MKPRITIIAVVALLWGCNANPMDSSHGHIITKVDPQRYVLEIDRNDWSPELTPPVGTNLDIWTRRKDWHFPGVFPAYPNPARPFAGEIVFFPILAKERSWVEIEITDQFGWVVWKSSGAIDPGVRLWGWAGKDRAGKYVERGFYIVKIWIDGHFVQGDVAVER